MKNINTEESNIEHDMDEKTEFTTSDYFTGSQSHGTVWLNPKESEEARREYDKLPVGEKKLRSLIAECYSSLDANEKAHKIYQWLMWLSAINSIDQRDFLFLDPNLRAWESVFFRKTEKDNILFNLTFMQVHKYVLDPNLWAGRSLKTTLFLYYLFITKKYIVYVKSEEQYCQYIENRWQVTQPETITEDFSAWLGKVSIRGVDKIVNFSAEREFLKKFKSALTIEEWPFHMGHNFKNGFLTLENERYTLYPHNPAFWARHMILIDVPPEIIPEIPNKMLRLYLDFTSEGVLNSNLFKVIMCFVVVEGNHNLIVNFSGNPRGAKSLIMDFIADVLGDSYKVGRLRGLNTFQREALLQNARIISFPDNNPKNIDKDGMDMLKAASGRDKILVEKKHGKIYFQKTNALLIISNNEDFDSVEQYKLEAFADRVLNFVTPSVKSEAVVGELKSKLEPEAIPALFLFGLSMDPEILSKAQRASQFNAVTGSGVEQIYIQFLLNQCVFVKEKKTKGQVLYQAYKNFYKTFDKKEAADSEKTFYKRLVHFLQLVTPNGVERYRATAGQTFKNILVGKAGSSEEGAQEFKFEGTEETKKMLEKNSFRIDHIIFKNKNGDYIKGPRLDPSKNFKMFETINNVKDTNLKQMIEGKCSITNGKHFETTGFGGEKNIHTLTKKDFEDNSPVLYQQKLQYGTKTQATITELANFEEPKLAKYFSRQLQPMILMPEGDPRISPAIEEMSQDLLWLREFNLKSNLFLSKFPSFHFNNRLYNEEIDLSKTTCIGPVEKVELKTYSPDIIEKEKEKEEIKEIKKEKVERKTKDKISKENEKQKKSKRSRKQNFEKNSKNSSKIESQTNKTNEKEEIFQYFDSKGFKKEK